MSLNFVPVVVPPTTPSARAQELGMRLAEVIRDYNRQHADVSNLEIRQALMIAAGTAGDGGLERRRALVAIVAALVVGLGFAVALAFRSGPGGGAASLPVIVGALVVFALVVTMILVRRGG